MTVLSGLNAFTVSITWYHCTSLPLLPTHQAPCYQGYLQGWIPGPWLTATWIGSSPTRLRGLAKPQLMGGPKFLTGLRRLFHFAVARELMEESMNSFSKIPKSGLFYPEKRGRRNFFTEDQIIKIYNGASDWMKPLIAISYYTGMRMSEVRKLRWDHVNLETGIIQLPESKTLKDPSGTGQRIVMQRELIDLFKILPKRSDDWVFVRADGLPYQHWDIHKPFKKLLKSLSIDADKFSWKDIRHTTGTLLHLKGADPLAIKDQLRHTTIRTTEDFYINSDVEYQRSQIERLSLKKEATA